jgi:outer membrane protein TolC
MMSYRLQSMVLALAMSFAGSVLANDDGNVPVAATERGGRPTSLTAREVAAIAAREAPAVMAARHEVEGAEADKDAINRLRYPDLALSARYTRLSAIPERLRTLSLPLPGGAANMVLPEFLNTYAARAALVVPLTDAWLGLAANVKALGHVTKAKELELTATQAQVSFEARSAFLIYRRAVGARRIAASALEIASAQLEDQEKRAKAGAAAASSTLTFEAARNAATARLHICEAETIATEAAIRVFLPKSLATVPLSLEEEGSPLPTSSDIQDSPLLKAALVAVSAADARVSAETMSALPRLALVAGAGVDAPSQRAFVASKLEAIPGWDITLQFEWSLSWLTTGAAKEKHAIAEREALRSRAEDVRRQLEAQQKSAVAAQSSAHARVASAQAGVATAQKLANARRTELSSGFATPLDLTAAESERVRAELEQEDAELELKLAEARLAFVGGYIESAPN